SPTFSDPPKNVMDELKQECRSVLPFSSAEATPADGPAIIREKGSGKKGIYLRIGRGQWVSENRVRVLISYYGGSHFGGGMVFTVENQNGNWVVISSEPSFIA
ncbi:MAG TPA: hypothetical protein VL181_03190, partial [Holophagaceae bacterium]|nr:hypothetical protein [Holophagaceae bacterium]